MALTLRETIKNLINDHLITEKGKVYGQCLTAVGWVGGTLPELYEKDGMIELSMADVAGGGIVTGAALSGSRPIYVVRYQGFQWYNCISIINYAAKSKEIWKRNCPILIRSIAMEGSIGPVAGSSHHSIYYRMPGLKIVSPMTPKEYKECYESFLSDDVPYYFSEHRKSYDNTSEFNDIQSEDADISILAFSVTRFEAEKAVKILNEMGIKCNLFHQVWIKPFNLNQNILNCISKSKKGFLILDDDYTTGISESLAYKIMSLTMKKGYCLGLEDKTAGFAERKDNLPPDSKKITDYIIKIINNNIN